MYLENVTNPEDRNNLIHTARLFTGQTGNKRLIDVISPLVQGSTNRPSDDVEKSTSILNSSPSLIWSKTQNRIPTFGCLLYIKLKNTWVHNKEPGTHRISEITWRTWEIWNAPLWIDTDKINLGLGGPGKKLMKWKLIFNLFGLDRPDIRSLIRYYSERSRIHNGTIGERGLLAWQTRSHLRYQFWICWTTRCLWTIFTWLSSVVWELQHSDGNENALEMDSSIHLHLSSKINNLEFSEDELGRYKIPLLGRQSPSRKGLGVAVVKLDKFIESFLISNGINNGRSATNVG